MSVFIKNMRIPTSCSVCAFCGYYGKGDHVCDITGKEVVYELGLEKRLDGCPLVELPPHGRLIDADALIARIRTAKELQPELSDLYENEALEMLLWVGTEPTVIEAENPFFESLKTGLEQAINGDARETTIEAEGSK